MVLKASELKKPDARNGSLGLRDLRGFSRLRASVPDAGFHVQPGSSMLKMAYCPCKEETCGPRNSMAQRSTSNLQCLEGKGPCPCLVKATQSRTVLGSTGMQQQHRSNSDTQPLMTRCSSSKYSKGNGARCHFCDTWLKSSRSWRSCRACCAMSWMHQDRNDCAAAELWDMEGAISPQQPFTP